MTVNLMDLDTFAAELGFTEEDLRPDCECGCHGPGVNATWLGRPGCPCGEGRFGDGKREILLCDRCRANIDSFNAGAYLLGRRIACAACRRVFPTSAEIIRWERL